MFEEINGIFGVDAGKLYITIVSFILQNEQVITSGCNTKASFLIVQLVSYVLIHPFYSFFQNIIPRKFYNKPSTRLNKFYKWYPHQNKNINNQFLNSHFILEKKKHINTIEQ